MCSSSTAVHLPRLGSALVRSLWDACRGSAGCTPLARWAVPLPLPGRCSAAFSLPPPPRPTRALGLQQPALPCATGSPAGRIYVHEWLSGCGECASDCLQPGVRAVATVNLCVHRVSSYEVTRVASQRGRTGKCVWRPRLCVCQAACHGNSGAHPSAISAL